LACETTSQSGVLAISGKGDPWECVDDETMLPKRRYIISTFASLLFKIIISFIVQFTIAKNTILEHGMLLQQSHCQ
jgi:hypothetical protein